MFYVFPRDIHGHVCLRAADDCVMLDCLDGLEVAHFIPLLKGMVVREIGRGLYSAHYEILTGEWEGRTFRIDLDAVFEDFAPITPLEAFARQANEES